jgi:signal transduction histidine kinase
VANSQFLALQLLVDPASAEYRRTLTLLVQLLNDYGESSLSAGQRRLLMEQVAALDPAAPAFPTFEAETLAAACLDTSPPLPAGSSLAPCGVPSVWQFATPDKTVVALLREERVRREMQELIDTELVIPDVAVTLAPPGTEPPEPASFFIRPSETFLPGWQMGLSLKGPDPFAAAADRRISVHLWTGVLVVVAFGTLAGLVTRYVGVQMRLTRLKNELLATVSHELKTPLSSIRALVETLLEGRCDDSRQRHEYLQLIAKENERLSRLIDNFLSFSRLERNEPMWSFADVDPRTVIEAALATQREKFAAPACRLDVELEPGLPHIAGDADALTTVLINLLDNAYKYTGSDKHVVLRAYSCNGTVSIDVRDNGIGLSRRAARRVFDRFYQADQSLSRRAGGCGLGLSIVRLIVLAHGGKVKVDSQLGQGSTFSVTLPKAGSRTLKLHHA